MAVGTVFSFQNFYFFRIGRPFIPSPLNGTSIKKELFAASLMHCNNPTVLSLFGLGYIGHWCTHQGQGYRSGAEKGFYQRGGAGFLCPSPLMVNGRIGKRKNTLRLIELCKQGLQNKKVHIYELCSSHVKKVYSNFFKQLTIYKLILYF